MKIRVLLLCLAAASSVSAQDTEVVQVSGMVVTTDSLSPLPYTTVYRTRDERGTMTDVHGFFSLPALVGDTLRISAVGFIAREVIVPEDLELPRMNVVAPMARDTVTLQEAFVYPWPTKERFREEFLALNLGSDAYTRGQEALDPIALYDRLMEVGRDGSEVYNYTMQQQAVAASYQGGLPPINLFSPVAWAQFVQALRRGDLKRQ
jgi:hypothetical protein